MAQKPSSDTMEINSILEEARNRNRTLASQQSNVRTRQAADVKPAARTTRTQLDDSGYVDISNSGAYNKQAQQAKKAKAQKKSKKPVIITVVVIMALLLVGVGGFTLYKYQTSGSSTVVADNVSVNGVDISGKSLDEAKKAMAGIEQSLADSIKVQIKADGKDYDLTKDNFTYTFNTGDVLDQIKQYSEEKSLSRDQKNFEIKMKFDPAKTQEAVDTVAKEIHAAPKNATVTKFDSSAKNMFTFQDEVVGKDVDSEDLLKKLSALLDAGKTSGTIDAVVNSVEPKLTVKYLESHIVKLSEFSTYSTNNANGDENMRISLAACNNSIIEPGATWSFNECTGDSNLESNGYKPAGVIVEGRSETGIGGGICQSSTTIYNAGLLCGMDVVERACHYYKSTYVDAGRDATIDYGNIDLKLKNPFKYQLFMKCWMDGSDLYCEIYGLENSNFDEVKISTSDPDYFSTGYTVKAWRTYYKNGKKVNEEELPKSTYYTVAPSSGNSDNNRDDDNDSSSSSSSSSSSGSSSSGGSSSTPASSRPETPADPGSNTPDTGGDDGGSDSGGEQEAPAPDPEPDPEPDAGGENIETPEG